MSGQRTRLAKDKIWKCIMEECVPFQFLFALHLNLSSTTTKFKRRQREEASSKTLLANTLKRQQLLEEFKDLFSFRNPLGFQRCCKNKRAALEQTRNILAASKIAHSFTIPYSLYRQQASVDYLVHSLMSKWLQTPSSALVE